MEEYLIKNTTREQREQIVKDSLGYSELGCDDAMDGYDMYLPGCLDLCRQSGNYCIRH